MVGIIHPAGFNDHQRLGTGAINAADVSEGVGSQPAAGNFLIRMKDLFAEGGKQHG